MFCPKCGIENPDNGKFCRGCGANLTNVLAVVEGEIIAESSVELNDNYTEIYTTGIRNVILGMGFIVTSIFLKTMPPADGFLWLLFMIPAFFLTASGVARILKAEEIKKSRNTKANVILKSTLSEKQPFEQLPPNQTDYVSPIGKYKTKDLVVPSVTEETTKHLKVVSDK
ncbi:MAG: zinc ribbon domain-containing protein [Acidobacteriota bacterium]